MSSTRFTILDEGRTATPVDAAIAGDRVRRGEDAVLAALGWSVEPLPD